MTSYAFDLTADTTDEEETELEEDDTWDNAFQPDTATVTPKKPRRSVSTSSSTRRVTRSQQSSAKSTQKGSSSRKPARSCSSGKKRLTNVFDGLSREIESEMKRTDSSGSATSEEENVEAGDEIVLVVQNKEQKRIRVRTTTEAPFRHVFEKYRAHAEEQGWIEKGDKLTFLFDDERIEPTDTAADLDCQMEDIIDVISNL